MRCPRCGFVGPGETECPKCGIVFEKYLRKQGQPLDRQANGDETVPPARDQHQKDETPGRFRALFFDVNPEAGLLSLIGRGLLLLVLFFWGLKFVFSPIGSNYSGESFLHLVNLPFHEAGHILFRIFGRFMAVLGGSLTQLLVPLICLLALLLKTRDTFGASVSLWWLGENLIDLAPYINDARDLNLILLGGVTGKDVDDYHDWEFILRRLGLLDFDHVLAKAAQGIGSLLMTCAVLWGGFLLLKQYENGRLRDRRL